MHIRKRTLFLLLALVLAVTALPAVVLAADASDAGADPAGATETFGATNPTTDEEIMAALETYDDSIDDPQYQRAYEAHQQWLKQQDSPQTFATRASTNPYTKKTYTHNHAKTKYIYDGIDVSKWQGTINWKKVKADGIDFAFIRCGNTSLSGFTMNTDAKFVENVKNAYAAGIKVGVYYYSGATSASEAKKEGNFVLNLVKPYKSKISLPVVMDYETNGSDRIYSNYKKTSKATRTKYVQNFFSPLTSAGFQGGVYASKAWLTDFFNMSSLTAYSTWVAQWSSSTSYAYDYDFWQYSDAGSIDGISGAVDCNFWYTDTKISGGTTNTTALTSSNTTVTLGYSTIPYSGSAKKPSVKVVYSGKTLTSGTDYTVSYSNNKEPGTATVKVTGAGKYSGTVSKTFKITALTTPYVTTSGVNYRTGCGTNYTKKGSVAKDKPVDVVYGWYKTVDGVKWHKIKIGSSYYYMSGNYLKHEVLINYSPTIKLNYRTGCGTNYAVKGKLTKGGTAQIIKGWNKKAGGNTWYKVKVSGSYYYCMAKYLKKQETLTLYATKAKVNVRSDAGTSKTLKTTLMAGTPVVVVSGGKKTVSGEAWYKVKIGSSYYYMMASYLVKS